MTAERPVDLPPVGTTWCTRCGEHAALEQRTLCPVCAPDDYRIKKPSERHLPPTPSGELSRFFNSPATWYAPRSEETS